MCDGRRFSRCSAGSDMPSSARVRPPPSSSFSESDELEAAQPISPLRPARRDQKPSSRSGRSVAAEELSSARGAHDRDSRGRDKGKSASSTGGGVCWQRILLVVLFICGPVGTVISFLLLPKEAESTDTLLRRAPSGAGTGTVARVRMVHLSLADSDRRARFVLDENTFWDSFLAGCRERLQVRNIRRVTDSSGEAILAVEVRAA